MNTNRFKIGDRVKVFDYRLYVNDTKTPPSITFKEATVVNIENCGGFNTIDVIFDHDQYLSKGHFTSFVERI